MYFGTGDITVIDNDATWVLMFNKSMHENLSLDNIYSLVREGKWTNDAMLKMCEAAAADVNGDGTRTWQSDNFGLATTGMTILGLFYSTGEKLTARDSDGYPILTPDTGRMADAIVSSARILSNANLSVVAGIAPEADVYAMETMFEEGRSSTRRSPATTISYTRRRQRQSTSRRPRGTRRWQARSLRQWRQNPCTR